MTKQELREIIHNTIKQEKRNEGKENLSSLEKAIDKLDNLNNVLSIILNKVKND